MAQQWADHSDDENEDWGTHVITTLPKFNDPRANEPEVKKPKKVKSIEERPPEPTVSTRITGSGKPAAPQPPSIREDGSTLSKKEQKAKELDDLDTLLAEFSVEPQEPSQAGEAAEAQLQPSQGRTAKTSKKQAFSNVRAEIQARKSNQKKRRKKKSDFPNP